jgi:hypothetical protein
MTRLYSTFSMSVDHLCAPYLHTNTTRNILYKHSRNGISLQTQPKPIIFDNHSSQTRHIRAQINFVLAVVYILEHINTHKHYNTICLALARPHTAPTASSDRSHNDMYQHTPFLHPYLFFCKARTMAPFLSYRRRHRPS